MTPSRMSFRQHFPMSLAGGVIHPAFWLVCGLFAACAGTPNPATPDEEGPTPSETPAEPEAPEKVIELDFAPLAAQATTDPEGVLNELDDELDAGLTVDEVPADFCLLYATASQALFDQRLAAGRLDPALATSLSEDVLAWSPRARERGADARATYRLELKAQQQLSDAGAAWEAARALAATLEELPADAPGRSADELLAGQAALSLTVAVIQVGDPVPAAAREGATLLARAADAGEPGAHLALSDLAAWQGMDREARAALEAGLLAVPTDATLLDRLRRLGERDRAGQVESLQAVLAAHPGEATILWYLGEAHYWRGRAARGAADTLLASTCWDQAEDAFRQAMSLREDFAASCEEWLHLVRTQRAWTLRDEGRIDDAAASLLASLRAAPERLEAEASPETQRLAIDAIVADYYRAEDLKSARGFLRQVLAIHDEDGNWCNNLGFFCRDLGIAAAMAGEAAQAQELFEESWEAYCRAVELLPEDPRIVNDRALIAVYYLDEHWDLAEQELHRSIQLGTAALAELGPDVPEQEQHDAEEAIGDAWENLAYLSLVRRGEIGDSETYLKNSVKYFPYEQRDGVQRLRPVLAELRRENP